MVVEGTNSHEPGWGGVGSKKNIQYTNVNIALDIIHFVDKCDFETANVIILHKFCQTIAHYWCSFVILMQNIYKQMGYCAQANAKAMQCQRRVFTYT